MTKLKTCDLIRLRQIDREKFEKVIKGYAEFFGKLTDEERKRIFKKDPNAELICEFISKLFKLSIKITEEKEVLERWFDSAKSKGFKGIELTQEIGIDKKKEYLIHLPFWQLNKIINEAEYYGDLDIAEKLLDIEDRTKNTESALAEFIEEINGRLDKIDKDIAEKLGELKETTVAIEDRTKNTESALASFREEINGRLDEIVKDITEKLGELKETTVAIEDRTKNTESTLELFREEVNGRLDKIDKDIAEKLGELKETTVAIEDRTKNTESALVSFIEEVNGRLDEIDKDIAEKLEELRETTVDIEDRTKKAESALASFREEINGRLDKVDSEIKEFKQESQQTFITIRATQYRTAIKSAHEEKDLIELLGGAVVKAAIDGISEAVEEGVKEGVKDLSKISFEQIKKYLLRLSDEELVKLSGEKWKSPEDFVEVPK